MIMNKKGTELSTDDIALIFNGLCEADLIDDCGAASELMRLWDYCTTELSNEFIDSLDREMWVQFQAIANRYMVISEENGMFTDDGCPCFDERLVELSCELKEGQKVIPWEEYAVFCSQFGYECEWSPYDNFNPECKG